MLNVRPDQEDGGAGQQQSQSFQERMMLYAKPIQPKPVKSRSRAGCKYCRDKRKKCSEDKPRCVRCIQFGVECVYEPIKKRKKRTTKFTVPSPPQAGSASTPDVGSSSATPPQPYQYGHTVEMADASMSDSTVTTSPSLLGFDDNLLGDNTYQLGPTPFELSGPVCGTQAEVIPSLAWSPGIDEDLLPWPYLSGSVMWDDTITAPQLLSPNPASPDFQFDLNVMGWMTAPSPLSGTLMPSFGSQLQQPAQSAPRPQRLDQDVLLDHFRSSIVLGQSVGAGDPIVQLIAPLCYKSSAVRDAACALTGAHLACTGAQDDIDYGLYYSQALSSIATLAPFQDAWDLEQALAVLLLLMHYEVLVQRGHLNRVAQHLNQGWQLLQLPLAGDLASFSFFEQAFGYFDSLHALSSNKAPVSSTSTDASMPLNTTTADSPLGLTSSLLPTIRRLADLTTLKRELDQAASISTASQIAVRRAEFDTSQAAIEQSLMAWEPPLPPGYTLVNRVVDGPEDAPEIEVAAVRSAASRGLAFKQAALTFLHRCVGGHAPGSEPVQRHARAALWHCVAAASSPYAAAVANAAAVPSPGERDGAHDLRNGTGAGLLWPLFVSSLEASEGRDRGMARQAFAALEGLKGVVNASKAWQVVLEVWRRKDMAKAGGGPDIGGMGWRRVAEEMGINIVFG